VGEQESPRSKVKKTGDYRVLSLIPSLFHREDNVLGNDYRGRYVKNCKWVGDKIQVAEWCQVYFGVVKMHHWIYESAHILHRDVSLRNIMFRRHGKNIYGVLIDFDLSSGRSYPSQYFSQRTGTIPFWALDLHEAKSPKHLYRHDLESFFYVFKDRARGQQSQGQVAS